jgi:hypothetical protein
MAWGNRAPLDQIFLHDLVAGTRLRRCYRLDRGPVVFWPSTDMRFAAAPRAMLYTGDTDTAAVSETLLRDPRPFPGTNQITLPYDFVRARGLATLRLRQTIQFVSLRRPAVSAVIQDPQHLDDVRALIETAAGYAETERFARALLAQAPAMHALAWPSRRVDGHTVYCFYDQPLTSADFDVEETVEFQTPAGYDRLEAAVANAGLQLVRAPSAGDPADGDP